MLPSPYRAALCGDLRALPGWLGELDRNDDVESRTWAAAARALWWFAQPDKADLPSDVADAEGEGAAELWSHLARVALLALDTAGLDRAIDRLARVDTLRARLWRDVWSAWRQILAGDVSGACAASEHAFAGARDARLSSLVVESMTLRAAAEMAAGDTSSATLSARRAARMAQSEHRWLCHFLASTILARVRRLGGRPHLAGVVAGACAEAAPAAFGGWLHWEQLFAGFVPSEPRLQTRAERAVGLAGDLLRSRAPSSVAGELADLVGESAAHRADVDGLLAVLGHAEPDTRIEAWLRGETTTPPTAIVGFAPPAWSDGDPSAAPVACIAPGHRGRRVLGFALADSVHRLEPLGSHAARPEALAAAMTLSGELDHATLFARVYGFPYRKSLHETTFKMARSRARKLLHGVAELESSNERVVLRALAPYAVPDPRCQQPLQETVLRFLASVGRATAKQLAERLGVPLRTVQGALREMTEDGVCASVREGRLIAYTVEDTTFCQITVV